MYDDLTDWICGSCSSYWTGYDNGTICDCGTPFVADWSGDQVSFRPLRNTEERPGFFEGPTYVGEDTGAPYARPLGGDDLNEQWEKSGGRITEEGGVQGRWDSRDPTVAQKACPKKPDISSIFKLSIRGRGTQARGYEVVQSDPQQE